MTCAFRADHFPFVRRPLAYLAAPEALPVAFLAVPDQRAESGTGWAPHAVTSLG